MKNIPVARKICARILIASFALTAASSAQACHWYDAPCKAREAAAAAKKAAEAAAAATKAAAEKAAAAAKAEAEKLAAAGAAISTSEMNTLVSQAKSAYSSSAGAVKSGYDKSVAALKAAYNAALEALFREAGKAAVSANSGALNKLRSNFKNLDAEGMAALNRIKRAIPTKQLNDQVGKDMQLLGSKLGLMAGQVNSNIPNNVTHSSWGVVIGGTGGEAIVGVETAYSLVMNAFPVNGKYSLGIMESVGGSLGASAGGTATSGGIFWSPGSIDENAGVSVGFGLEAALGPGAGLGLSWNVEKGMSGAANAIPGIALTLEEGGKLSAAFNAGYSVLVAKF